MEAYDYTNKKLSYSWKYDEDTLDYEELDLEAPLVESEVHIENSEEVCNCLTGFLDLDFAEWYEDFLNAIERVIYYDKSTFNHRGCLYKITGNREIAVVEGGSGEVSRVKLRTEDLYNLMLRRYRVICKTEKEYKSNSV